jgi:hypothetical protein
VIPDLNSKSAKRQCGDNIYASDGQGGFVVQPSKWHDEGDMLHDTGGRHALVSKNFWYFGQKAFVPPEGWSVFLREVMSDARTFYCPEPFLERIKAYFGEHGIAPGVQADPCMWNEGSKNGCGSSCST